jgi:hypothetical protein
MKVGKHGINCERFCERVDRPEFKDSTCRLFKKKIARDFPSKSFVGSMIICLFSKARLWRLRIFNLRSTADALDSKMLLLATLWVETPLKDHVKGLFQILIVDIDLVCIELLKTNI